MRPEYSTGADGAKLPRSTSAPCIGETYEVTELLGQGGMGAVWAAQHLRLPGKRVAIKVLLGAAASDRESLARFRREAEIASRIGHPNIVEVLDFNTLPSGTPYLVLEYLDGESLAQRLGAGRSRSRRRCAIARQIGSALHAAHAPTWCTAISSRTTSSWCRPRSGGELVDRVKVLDFGISKIRGSQTVQTQESVLLGTPQYMSPEQALGQEQRRSTQRTDVFALGAIVYEMLVGRAGVLRRDAGRGGVQGGVRAGAAAERVAPALPRNVVAARSSARWQKDVDSAGSRRGRASSPR